MPQMASITVKNAADSDVEYVAATASAGDRSPAVWFAASASSIIGHRPKLTVSTRDNGRANGRHITGSFRFPIVEEVNGKPSIVATMPMTFEGTLPTNVPSNLVTDGFTQFGNLVASELMREVAEAGYSPT